MASAAMDPQDLVLGAHEPRPEHSRRVSPDARGAEGHARRASLGGVAASRPEMAPQKLEMIESAPGNGMASSAIGPTRSGTGSTWTWWLASEKSKGATFPPPLGGLGRGVAPLFRRAGAKPFVRRIGATPLPEPSPTQGGKENDFQFGRREPRVQHERPEGEERQMSESAPAPPEMFNFARSSSGGECRARRQGGLRRRRGRAHLWRARRARAALRRGAEGRRRQARGARAPPHARQRRLAGRFPRRHARGHRAGRGQHAC